VKLTDKKEAREAHDMALKLLSRLDKEPVLKICKDVVDADSSTRVLFLQTTIMQILNESKLSMSEALAILEGVKIEYTLLSLLAGHPIVSQIYKTSRLMEVALGLPQIVLVEDKEQEEEKERPDAFKGTHLR